MEDVFGSGVGNFGLAVSSLVTAFMPSARELVCNDYVLTKPGAGEEPLKDL